MQPSSSAVFPALAEKLGQLQLHRLELFDGQLVLQEFRLPDDLLAPAFLTPGQGGLALAEFADQLPDLLAQGQLPLPVPLLLVPL